MLNCSLSERQKIVGTWYAMGRPYNCKIWGFHRSGLGFRFFLGCDAVSCQ